MLYKLLADGVVFVHLGYVGFVVVAQLLIIVGLLARWQWVRNLRFRVIHLIMVEVVALEGWFGIICPMTDWDTQLRAQVHGDDKVTVAPAGPQTAQPPPPPLPAPPEPEPQPAPSEPQPASPSPASQEPPQEENESTFVGQLLSSVLYVEVPQSVLDTWYVRFGLITLALFVLFPPRLGQWNVSGLAGVVLLWTGLLFTCTAYHQQITREQTTPPATASPHRLTPLEFGGWIICLGGACFGLGWWRRTASRGA